MLVLRLLTSPRTLSLVSLITLWWVGSLFSEPDILPSPATVGAIAWQNMLETGPEGKTVYFHFLLTLGRILLALSVSMTIGILLGLAMGTSWLVERAFENVLTFWMTFPTLLMVLLGVLWFGFQELAGIFAVVMVVTPFIVTNIWGGTRAIDRGLIDMGKAFHARRELVVRKIIIPQLLPYLFSSFRLAFGVTWKIVAVAETFGLRFGVGYMFTYWFSQFELAQVLAWIMLFVVFMLVLEHGVIAVVERKAFAWRPSLSA